MKTSLLKYLAPVALLAALSPATEVQMQAERVALFKNGYACVQMQGKLPADARLSVRNMPQPILGSFRWQAPVSVVRLEGREREVEIPGAQFNYEALLQANEGKQAIIETANGAVYQGKICLPPKPEANTGSFIYPTGGKDEQPRLPALRDKVLLHMLQGGSVCLGVGEIRSLEFPASEQPRLPMQKIKLTELDIQLAAPAPEGTLRLSSLSRGLSWLPSYSLTLGEDGQAELVCKATIINDLVDLKGVELELVSGFPALGSFLVPSALADAGAVLRVIDMLGLEQQQESGVALMTNRASFKSRMVAGGSELAASAEQLSRAEDLFYYSIPNFTCRRGETVLRPVFAVTVPYKHVYTCDVPNQSQLQRLSRSGSPIADVWHCVRLTNKGIAPWSAGVVTCTSGGHLVARAGLEFTAPEQESLLKLNKTFDATISCREELVRRGIPRRQQARRGYEAEQTSTTYRGYLTLRNASDKPMDVELTKAITGTAVEATDAGQIDTTPTYSDNARSSILWKATLAPGEEKTFTYTYEYQE